MTRLFPSAGHRSEKISLNDKMSPHPQMRSNSLHVPILENNSSDDMYHQTSCDEHQKLYECERALCMTSLKEHMKDHERYFCQKMFRGMCFFTAGQRIPCVQPQR